VKPLGPDAQFAAPARPTASAGAACVARVRSAGGPARPRPERRARRATHGARQRCSASRGRHGTGAREAAKGQRLTGVGTADGGTASTSDRDGGAVGEATVGTRRVGEAVGTAARSTRRWSASGECEALSGAAQSAGRQLSGRATRCPDSGFKPRCRSGTWRQRGSGALPRGPGAARDG
jgi:hypothetical protein